MDEEIGVENKVKQRMKKMLLEGRGRVNTFQLFLDAFEQSCT